MGTQLLPKGHSPQILGPYLLRPNGWMDQDATWYGARPRPRRHCVKWDPAPPKKGHIIPHFLVHVYCGQTSGWIKMPLVTDVDLGPDHLDEAQLPFHGKRHCSPCLYWPNGRPSELLLSSCSSLCHYEAFRVWECF